jgi:hypothetical protein
MGLIVQIALLALLATGLLAMSPQAAANETVQGRGAHRSSRAGQPGLRSQRIFEFKRKRAREPCSTDSSMSSVPRSTGSAA